MKFRKLKILLGVGLSCLILASCGKKEAKELQQIKVGEDAKVAYNFGESFITPVVTAYYSDNSEKIVSASCVFSGFNSNVEGPEQINVKYTENEKTAETKYTVIIGENPNFYVESISFSNVKNTYEYQEEFVKPTVTAHFSDTTTKDVTNETTFTGFDSTKPGEQTINASYTFRNKEVKNTFKVTVAERPQILMSIAVDQAASKLEYEWNEQFVNPVVIVTYDYGNPEDVSDACTYGPFIAGQVGQQTISVSYEDKTTSYVVTVKERQLIVEEIELSNVTTEFAYGDDFIMPTVTATFDDTSTKDVTSEANYTGFNSEISGHQTVTITYTYNGKTVSKTLDIVIGEPPARLVDIEFSSEPKITYRYEEEFTKPTVIAKYDDTTSKDVTELSLFTGFDSTKPGEQTIGVSYTENRIEKTLSYKVTIGEAQEALKFAIFADVQLCAKEAKEGKAANLGETANAPLALESHFQFVKDHEINVVLMNGDITNQANQAYYEYFEEILIKVFGEDESKYPEFIWNMGNHEWWWGTSEKETGDAVTMFKQHARIESENLVKTSNIRYALNPDQTIPTYYKIINGIPLLVISGEDSNGTISDALYQELQGWLDEIKQLDSVKRGGPIYVQYHYPLTTSMTHGQGSHIEYCGKIEELFANTPNAVVFTGDTHFPGNNERSINQVDFTTINLGTSSYSRMVSESAVICDQFDNVTSTSASSKADKMIGAAKFKNAYTPNISIVTLSEDHSYTIDRYFSDVPMGRKVGEQWHFNPIKTKNDFTYTDARFQNPEAAKTLYGADGLSWDDVNSLKVGLNGTQMTVQFPDVNEYHFAEHYRISVNGQVFDEVSNYYKYPQNPEQNYYILNNIALADTYHVEVTAYDFFDNPSLNKLQTEVHSDNFAVDPIDYQSTLTYTDITTKNNFENVSENSHSSIEYYYKGIQNYKNGAILNRLICTEGQTEDCSEFINFEYQEGYDTFVTADVYNKMDEAITIGLTVVDGDGNWKSDFGGDTRQEVAPREWTTLRWNLTQMYGIKTKDDMSIISYKAQPANNGTGVYEMSFLLDNIDVYAQEHKEERNPTAFNSNDNVYIEFPDYATYGEIINLDFKVTSANPAKFALYETNWGKRTPSFQIYSDGLHSTYDGVTATVLEDGFIRLSIDMREISAIDTTDDEIIRELHYLFIDKSSQGAGYYQVMEKTGEPITPPEPHIVRGIRFTTNQWAKDLVGDEIKYVATDNFVIDVKFDDNCTSEQYLQFFIGHGWGQYFGTYRILANGTLGDTYNGITISLLDDGYYRVTLSLKDLTKGQNLPTDYINLINIEHSTATGYIDINPAL